MPTPDAMARAAWPPAQERFERFRRTSALFLGPALFAAVLAVPLPGLSPQAHSLGAVVAWVLVYWIGEPIPIPATALMGPVLCVLLGVGEPAQVFAPFANPIIFLFLGSFLLAQGMIVHRLNERIAFSILSVRWLLARGYRLALAIAAIPLLLSMWISDSATTAMVYPILLGVLATLGEHAGKAGDRRFESGLLLTISYSALIGGTGTPVGTPPNLIGIGMLDKLAGVRIPFFQWMVLAVPIALTLAAVMYSWLTLRHAPRVVDAARLAAFVDERRRALGAWSAGERNTLVAFLVAVFLWVGPGVLASVRGPSSPEFKFVERHVPEGVASLVAALLLFLLPVDWKKRRFTLTWADAAGIDWGTILLFGGGLSLGSLVFSTGLADALGRAVVDLSGARSVWGLTAVAAALAITLTELTSNTATASMLVPLFIALAKTMGVSPVPATVAVCLASSMAFMLPVSTPSNAIVYGSGRVPITQMIRAGFVMDLASFLVVVGGLRVLCPLLGLA